MIADPVWVVGAGAMAFEYVRVLESLGRRVVVIGRSERVAAGIRDRPGVMVRTGGLDAYLQSAPEPPSAAIVAVGVEALAAATRSLLHGGASRILVEKPGALAIGDLVAVRDLAADRAASVVIGYNRRAFASVREARRRIAEEGGVTSFAFEFTEWAHRIEPLPTPAAVKARWLLANSSHVIDLAFHLGGAPMRLEAVTSGALPWHPSASAFAGSGMTRDGAPFAYHADWNAPGRWGVELMTRRNRYVLRPLEQLQVMGTGSTAVEVAAVDDALDQAFKPGLRMQVEEFLDPIGRIELCTIDEQIERWGWYTRIAGYPD